MALEQGSQGEAVARVQRALAQQGFDPGGDDGRFGPRTAAAVGDFQRARGLGADGVVGDTTWRALGLSGSVPRPVQFD